MDGERPVFPPHFPLCTPMEAWRLVSQERSLGGMQELELKGRHWEATLWCPHCRALPNALLSRCGPLAPSKVARAFQVASWVEISWV